LRCIHQWLLPCLSVMSSKWLVSIASQLVSQFIRFSHSTADDPHFKRGEIENVKPSRLKFMAAKIEFSSPSLSESAASIDIANLSYSPVKKRAFIQFFNFRIFIVARTKEPLRVGDRQIANCFARWIRVRFSLELFLSFMCKKYVHTNFNKQTRSMCTKMFYVTAAVSCAHGACFQCCLHLVRSYLGLSPLSETVATRKSASFSVY
jgi:hypothetical protein